MTAFVDSVRLGTELPQIIHEPPDIASYAAGEDAIDLANSYLFDDPACLAPSQELRLRNGMATRADGKWAASRVGDFGGRQGAGKTDTVLARILSGVLLLGHKLIIYTAHEYPTANEIFIRLGGVLGGWDDLAGLVAHERRAHGDQGFELKDASRGIDCRILIKTRTGKSGRGFAKADLIIYDEAQHLLPEHVAGSGPAKLAHPNPQSWWAGSGGLEASAKAREMRFQALTGTGGRLSYTEHTAQGVSVEGDRLVLSDPDPEDREAWAQANPGLGRWVTEEGMEDMRAELGDLFPREGLCVWAPDPGADTESSIPNWPDLAHEGSTIESHASWALAVSPVELGPQWAALGKAGRTATGELHVEWVEHRRGTHWIVATAKAHAELNGGLPLRVHESAPEGAFIADLVQAGVDVVPVGSADVARATGALIAAASGDPDEGVAPSLVHLGQASLSKAVQGAVLRTSAEGAASWSQKNSKIEITPLKAVTVAAGGVPVTDQSDAFVASVIGG